MPERTPFRYAERAAPPEVAPWLLAAWSFAADAETLPDDPFTVWPDGCLSVAVVRTPTGHSDIVFTGPRVSAFQPPVRPGARLWGLRFWPDVPTDVFGIPARTLRDGSGPAPSPLARWAAGMAESLKALDDTSEDGLLRILAWSRSALANAPPPDPVVRRAVQAIVAARGIIQMRDVAERSGIGLRQLQRRFSRATGLTLREWARVRRLREALAARIDGRRSTWSAIAADTGFVDHAHLTREFATLTGLTPSRAARQMRATAHGDVRP